MKRSHISLLLILILMIVSLVSCDRDAELLGESSIPKQSQTAQPTPIAEIELPAHIIAQEDLSETVKTTNSITFSSAEEAYYDKYIELAEKYGTYSLYDYYHVKGDYSGRSYLNGVCIVNLMDFNGDGTQDLFVIYSNKQMKEIAYDGFDLEIYDFPTKYTYEIEIWTYKDGALTSLLHESQVSKCNIFANNDLIFRREYYQIFITVFENSHGYPVIQIFDEDNGVREYINIYSSNGQIVRDKLRYDGDNLLMNGLEIIESEWSERVAGYNKILLCSLLADSNSTSSSLLSNSSIDYDNTLLQTERVVRYLSQEDRTPVMARFDIAEEAYISLYLQEIERANRIRHGGEFTENHRFALYDMDQNGVPELILYEGSSGAGTHHHFYTVINNEIVDCGFYGRTSLNINGNGGLVAYFARMGGYWIEELYLKDNNLLSTEIAEGYTQEDYPELDEFGYDGYEYLPFCPPEIPFALYAYMCENDFDGSD